MLKQFQRRRRPGRFSGQKWPTHPISAFTIFKVFLDTSTGFNVFVVFNQEVAPYAGSPPSGWTIGGQAVIALSAVDGATVTLQCGSPITVGDACLFYANPRLTSLAGVAMVDSSPVVEG